MTFGISRHGEPIYSVPLSNRLETGITYDDIRLEFGLLAEYEERETAFKAQIRWEDWLVMDTRERAYYVAHQRVRQLIEGHVQDASNKDAERRAKRGRNRGS